MTWSCCWIRSTRPDGVLPWHPFNNVLRVDPAGHIVWHAELVPGETAAKCWLSGRSEIGRGFEVYK